MSYKKEIYTGIMIKMKYRKYFDINRILWIIFLIHVFCIQIIMNVNNIFI